jgi:hypothetical protein
MGLTDERILVGGLVLLWLAVRESAPDGDITSWNPLDVACAAGFDSQDADPLYRGLHECGFLEGDNGTVRLHDWMEHNGRFTRDAERMRSVRERARTCANVPECSDLARAPGAGAGAGALQEQESTPLSIALAPDARVTTAKPPDEWLESFADFWTAYPRKIAKPAALRSWKAIKPQNCDEWNHIMDGLDRWAAFWKAKGQEPSFIPHASTWLNQRRWEDRP